MADSQHTNTCQYCGQQAERSVDYHRDRRWPETYCYDAAGHAWITRSQESEDHAADPIPAWNVMDRDEQGR